MNRVQTGPLAGLGGALALLGLLVSTSDLGPLGALVGVGLAFSLTSALTYGLDAAGSARLGPADRVTLLRAVLVIAVAALVAQSLVVAISTSVLVALSSVALLLDAVDGKVARSTGTESAFGARFDMEIDALLILVLSILVAAEYGLWVLSLGIAHYLLLAARTTVAWMRAPLPPRHWCKVVAALQGIVLTAAAAGVLPTPATLVVLVAAGALLAESFGREVGQLWLLREPSDRRQGEVALASREESVALSLGTSHR